MSPLAQLTSEKNIGNSPLASERPADILSADEIKRFSKHAWFRRAIAPGGKSLHLRGKGAPASSVLTMSYEQDGKAYLVPTIRLSEEGELEVHSNKAAIRISQEKGDGIVFGSEKEATDASKRISKYLGWLGNMRRKEQMSKSD